MLVEQALLVGEAMNAAAFFMTPTPSARVQFIAHIIGALALADANSIQLHQVQSTVRDMYREMVRTRREARPPKRKPNLVILEGKKEPDNG